MMTVSTMPDDFTYDFLAEDALFDLVVPSDQLALRQGARRFSDGVLRGLHNAPEPVAHVRKLMADLGLPEMMCADDTPSSALALVLEEIGSGPLEDIFAAILPLLITRLSRDLGMPSSEISGWFESVRMDTVGGLGFSSVSNDGTVTGLRLPDARWILALDADRDGGGQVMVIPVANVPADRWRLKPVGRLEVFSWFELDTGAAKAAAACHFSVFETHLRAGLDRLALTLSALLIGTLRDVVIFVYDYTRLRTTFGKAIINHQAVGMNLADMATMVEAARLMVFSAARKADRGSLTPATLWLLARHLVTAATETTAGAVQVCGAHGYVEGLPPAGRFRDALLVSAVLDLVRSFHK